MANYRQYTQCVDIANFNPAEPKKQAALIGLYVALPVGGFAALLAIAGLNPWCLFLLAEIWFFASVVGYCYWWLYRRLICIPSPPDHPADSSGNQMAIGLLIDIVLPATEPSLIDRLLDRDNDFSMGILPACLPLGAQMQDVINNPGPYGYLIEEQPVTRDAHLTTVDGQQYPFGQLAADHSFPGHPELEIKSQVLHCEFEGRGIYDVFLAARAAIFPAIAALFACQIPGVGWLITLILALLGFIFLGAGIGLGYLDAGEPTDVNPNLGELHTNDANHTGADTLVVMGHWVCDAGHRYDSHELYYELHPITFCCKTTPVTDCDPNQVIFLKKRWQNAVNDATSPATLEAQKLPQNQWRIHPVIDGCQPAVIV